MCGTQEWLPADVRRNAMCVIEGVNGVVFPNGSQQMLAGDRSDCNAEGAMAAAFRAALEAQPGGDTNTSVHFAAVSKKLLDYIFIQSGSHINSSFVSWGHMKEQASMAAANNGGGHEFRCRLPVISIRMITPVIIWVGLQRSTCFTDANFWSTPTSTTKNW